MQHFFGRRAVLSRFKALRFSLFSTMHKTCGCAIYSAKHIKLYCHEKEYLITNCPAADGYHCLPQNFEHSPTQCPVGFDCNEGVCDCNDPTERNINGVWCTGRGPYLASFDDWFCIDTFQLAIGFDQLQPSQWGGYSLPMAYANKRGIGTHFYGGLVKLPDGDSIYASNLPSATGPDLTDCIYEGNVCWIALAGKMISPDTLDAWLTLNCTQQDQYPHKEQKHIQLIKIK
jgi:hypothetical protein